MPSHARWAGFKVIMVNETLVEGIKNALVRGESLPQAMQSLLNAGYDKKEIDESSRMLNLSQGVPGSVTNLSRLPLISNYAQRPSEVRTGLVIFLIIALTILFGSLVGIFLFRTELMSFINSLF